MIRVNTISVMITLGEGFFENICISMMEFRKAINIRNNADIIPEKRVTIKLIENIIKNPLNKDC
jgi:hypothetical protein